MGAVRRSVVCRGAVCCSVVWCGVVQCGAMVSGANMLSMYIFRYVMRGSVSWGDPSCRYMYSVYVRISSVVNWIRETMSRKTPVKYPG